MTVAPSSARTKSGLTPSEQTLLGWMQTIGHGQIRNLIVRDGEPQVDPRPAILRRRRLPKRPDANVAAEASDFSLKRGVIEFFDELRSLRNGKVELVKIQDGLPVEIELLESGQT